MFLRISAFSFSLYLLNGLFHLALAANVAGQIELAVGEVKLIGDAGVERLPRVNDPVFERDTVLVAGDGELHIRMEDQGFIAVRPNTKMRIDDYRAEGDENDKSVITLLKGTFRSITGWIGIYNRNNYRINTPTATLGIRGTDHEPLYIPQPPPGEEPIGKPGTYDKVNTGSTYMQNSYGKIDLQANQAGFVPHAGAEPPKVLAKIPSFFRQTKYEHLIEQKKELLHDRMEERLQAKRRKAQPGSSHKESVEGETKNGNKSTGPKKDLRNDNHGQRKERR